MPEKTKYISEAEYLKFKDGFRDIVIEIIVGFIIGAVLAKLTKGDWQVMLLVGILFAGMPYAWSVIPIYFFGIIGILVKVIISCILGWFITPVALIYNFIQMKRYEKSVMYHVNKEENEKAEDVERENNNFDRVIDAIHELKK